MKKLLQILLFTFVLGLFVPELEAVDVRSSNAPGTIQRAKARKALRHHRRTVRRQKRQHRRLAAIGHRG